MTQQGYLVDYHVHETYSSDARNSTVESYIKVAEKIGLKEIAFATHFIITGYDKFFGIQEHQIADYVENIKNLDETTDVKLLVSLEVDYFPDEEKRLEKILDDYCFDYVLGSTHYPNDVDIGSRKHAPGFFAGRSLGEACDEFYSFTKMAVESGLFDVVAHLDYWRKFLHLVRDEPVELKDYGTVVYDLFDAMNSHEVGLEVNTSGRRHKHGVQYPIKEFLQAAYASGVDRITIGSDSHVPDTLGYWLPEAVDLLRDLGFNGISRYKDRKRTLHPI
ncbi:MAG: histidinol-phosphatase HisJ family protein [Candidatus Bathyarchaeota archaeon]|nr:histidinol-phosphatase HisJ family protein [Candidatus Bathyarchaeota archaeon]